MTQSQQTHDAIVGVMNVGSVIMLLLVLAFYLWLKFNDRKSTKKNLQTKIATSKAKQKRPRSRRTGR
ncbi:hypothetical protein [Herbaspirillum chlorophenolicum]|uniref:hypothetical protein n=1 Tax=Herbaspirillum chlorophenolicum TaxID=211589 RepID=UPI00067B3F5D|nr:hypothetical protein [Herbaspirillum chlorophenolicum]